MIHKESPLTNQPQAAEAATEDVQTTSGEGWQKNLESITRESDSDDDGKIEDLISKGKALRAQGCLGCRTTSTKQGKEIKDFKGMIAHANQCKAFNALPEQQQQQWMEELKSSERCLFCGQKHKGLLQHMRSCRRKN